MKVERNPLAGRLAFLGQMKGTRGGKGKANRPRHGRRFGHSSGGSKLTLEFCLSRTSLSSSAESPSLESPLGVLPQDSGRTFLILINPFPGTISSVCGAGTETFSQQLTLFLKQKGLLS